MPVGRFAENGRKIRPHNQSDAVVGQSRILVPEQDLRIVGQWGHKQLDLVLAFPIDVD
jgi:hypothetical protein